MKIHHFDDNLNINNLASYWWQFITLKQIITVINIHHCDDNHHSDGYTSLWWKFIIVMKIHHFDDNSSLWWVFIAIIMNIYHCDKNSSDEWNFVTLIDNDRPGMKIHHYNKDVSLSGKYNRLITIYHWFITQMKRYRVNIMMKISNINECSWLG